MYELMADNEAENLFSDLTRKLQEWGCGCITLDAMTISPGSFAVPDRLHCYSSSRPSGIHCLLLSPWMWVSLLYGTRDLSFGHC